MKQEQEASGWERHIQEDKYVGVAASLLLLVFYCGRCSRPFITVYLYR